VYPLFSHFSACKVDMINCISASCTLGTIIQMIKHTVYYFKSPRLISRIGEKLSNMLHSVALCTPKKSVYGCECIYRRWLTNFSRHVTQIFCIFYINPFRNPTWLNVLELFLCSLNNAECCRNEPSANPKPFLNSFDFCSAWTQRLVTAEGRSRLKI